MIFRYRHFLQMGPKRLYQKRRVCDTDFLGSQYGKLSPTWVQEWLQLHVPQTFPKCLYQNRNACDTDSFWAPNNAHWPKSLGPCSLPIPCGQSRARHHHVLAPPAPSRKVARHHPMSKHERLLDRARGASTWRSPEMPSTTTCSLLRSQLHSVGTIIPEVTSQPVVTRHPVLPFSVFIHTAPRYHIHVPSGFHIIRFRCHHQKLAQQPLCQLNENPRTRGALGKKRVYCSATCWTFAREHALLSYARPGEWCIQFIENPYLVEL